MRKLSLLARMRRCGRRRPLIGLFPGNATDRVLPWAHPAATSSLNGDMRPTGMYAEVSE